MEENNKYLEVAIRLFDSYIDLWFKNIFVLRGNMSKLK